MLDKTKVREIAAKYAEEVRKILNPSAIILFGSYANGNPHEWSDIDIAIILKLHMAKASGFLGTNKLANILESI